MKSFVQDVLLNLIKISLEDIKYDLICLVLGCFIQKDEGF